MATVGPMLDEDRAGAEELITIADNTLELARNSLEFGMLEESSATTSVLLGSLQAKKLRTDADIRNIRKEFMLPRGNCCIQNTLSHFVAST